MTPSLSIKVRVRASYLVIAIFVENDNQSFTDDSAAAAVDAKIRRWTIDRRVDSSNSPGTYFQNVDFEYVFVDLAKNSKSKVVVELEYCL